MNQRKSPHRNTMHQGRDSWMFGLVIQTNTDIQVRRGHLVFFFYIYILKREVVSCCKVRGVRNTEHKKLVPQERRSTN